MNGFSALFDFFEFLFRFAVFSALTLVTALLLFIVSFTPLWTPYLYLSFIVPILLSGYINRQLLK